jgi:hypothetical protein
MKKYIFAMLINFAAAGFLIGFAITMKDIYLYIGAALLAVGLIVGRIVRKSQ